jgi:hypothetical protein
MQLARNNASEVQRCLQVRQIVPDDEWEPCARVFAQLQSILSAELGQQAELAALTLELCDSAAVLPPDVRMQSGSDSDTSDNGAASGDETSRSDDRPAQQAGLRDTHRHPDGRPVDRQRVGDELAALGTMLRSTAEPKEAELSVEDSHGTTLLQEMKQHADSADAPSASSGLQTALPVDPERIGEQLGALASSLGIRDAVDNVATGVRDAADAVASVVTEPDAPQPLPVAEVAGPGSSRWHANGITPGAEHVEDLGDTLRWFAARVHHGPVTHAEARQLDALFMRQLLTLAGQGHFQGAPCALHISTAVCLRIAHQPHPCCSRCSWRG